MFESYATASVVSCPEIVLDQAEAEVRERDMILRFRASERHLHWAIAVPFMVCYASAAVLVLVYNPAPARPLHHLFSWVHRLSGACLILLPLLTVVLHRRDISVYIRNLRWAWGWTWADIKWLLLFGPANITSKVKLPEQGKFNAGEKINFVMLMCTYPVYVCTGLVIWLSAVPFTTWLIHIYTAVFVATPLMLGHIYMAVVNKETRVGLSGMFSGKVDREWAMHHYRHWYDEAVANEPREDR